MRKTADKERIAKLYLDGMSAEKIAETEGLSEHTIYKALREKGVAIRHNLDIGKIIALARAGWKPADIAGDIGASEQEVADVLNRCRKQAEHA